MPAPESRANSPVSAPENTGFGTASEEKLKGEKELHSVFIAVCFKASKQ